MLRHLVDMLLRRCGRGFRSGSGRRRARLQRCCRGEAASLRLLSALGPPKGVSRGCG
jgi:hypothetical protein